MLLSACTAVSLAACGGISESRSRIQSPASTAAQKESMKKHGMAERVLADLPAGTRIYHLRSVTISTRSSTATFPGISRVILRNGKLEVSDPSSGQTFEFDPESSVSYRDEGTDVYVRPGQAIPGWLDAARGSIQRIEVKQ